ncbi:MAG: iron ABC transporter permease [Clostridia bacterium]|nr:iron ABC transporter permease [Clostridia bacterium]
MKLKSTFTGMTGLILLLVISIICATTVGSADLSVSEVIQILISHVKTLGHDASLSGAQLSKDVIIWQVRLPRILMSGLVGGALALVGASFQGCFRNPLADPHILGVSSGAALGATLAILSGISLNFIGLGTIGIFAFIGAVLTIFLVYYSAYFGGGSAMTNMLLMGTAISTMLSAFISLIMTFHHNQIAEVYLWTMGSFSSASWEKILFVLIFIIIGGSVLFAHANAQNIMALGEDDAKCLGIDTDKVRLRLIAAASILVAASVSVSGIVGFVGLIIPHCVRILSGADYKRILPYSFLGGAIFLILCDTVARTIAAPTEIPVGIITAVIGAPYFIFLIIRKRVLSA